MQEAELFARQLAREKRARKEAEAIIEQKSTEIYEKNAKILAILDATADGIIGLNDALQIEISNQAASELFALPTEKLKGKLVSELIPHIQPFLVSGQQKSLYEGSIQYPDNTMLPIELAITRVSSIPELSTLCVIRNVTERKKAEAYLEMQHAITRTLAEYAAFEKAVPEILKRMCEFMHCDTAILWEVDMAHQVLRCAHVYATKVEGTLKEFCDVSKTFLFQHGEGLPGRIWEMKSFFSIKDVVIDPNFPRAKWALNANLHSAFGFPIFFEGNLVGVFEFFMNRFADLDENLTHILKDIANQIGVFIDRENARKKTLEGLESIKSVEALVVEYKKSKEAAESASKIKSEFLANMSHELRTPLSTIIGYTEMLEEKAEETKLSEYSTYLKKVISSAKHLLELINDVLDLSKIESGKMDIFLEDFNLDQLVKELESQMNPLFEKNKNTFKVILSSEFNVMHSDILRVRQSLLNLLTNANKFTQAGTILLEITSHQKNNKEPCVQFAVTDTGVGMNAKQIEKLFQSFSQGDSSTTRKYGGTGLGLYLTKHFCEMLGGDITVKSEVGKGSVFTINLPLRGESRDETVKSLKHTQTDKVK